MEVRLWAAMERGIGKSVTVDDLALVLDFYSNTPMLFSPLPDERRSRRACSSTCEVQRTS